MNRSEINTAIVASVRACHAHLNTGQIRRGVGPDDQGAARARDRALIEVEGILKLAEEFRDALSDDQAKGLSALLAILEERLRMLKEATPHDHVRLALEFESGLWAAIQNVQAVDAIALMTALSHTRGGYAHQTRFETEDEIRTKLSEVRELGAKVVAASEGVAIKLAQEQFRDAARDEEAKVQTWRACTIAAVVLAMIVLILSFAVGTNSTEWTPRLILHVAGKVAILAVLVAIAEFTGKMWRGAMHRAELNRHRERLANSLVALAQSVGNEREVVIRYVLEHLCEPGDLGILARDRSFGSSLSLDAGPVKFSQGGE